MILIHSSTLFLEKTGLSRPERRPLLLAHGRQPSSHLKTSRAHNSTTFLNLFHSCTRRSVGRDCYSIRSSVHAEASVWHTGLSRFLFLWILIPTALFGRCAVPRIQALSMSRVAISLPINTHAEVSCSSIEVPFCHQAFHVTCLARSFSSCGFQCPLCIILCVQFVPWVHDRCGPHPVGFPPRPETPVFSSNWPATPVWTVERPPDGVVSISCGTFFRVDS